MACDTANISKICHDRAISAFDEKTSTKNKSVTRGFADTDILKSSGFLFWFQF